MEEALNDDLTRWPKIRAWLQFVTPRPGRGHAGWLLLTPPLLVVLFFTVAPVLSSLVLSLQSGTGFGLANYAKFFEHGQYLESLANTVWFSVVASFLTVVLAFPACLYVCERHGFMFNLFLGALGVALAISGLIRTVSWQIILSRSGMVDATLQFFGITSQPLDLLYSKAAVLIGMTQIMLPVAAMALLNGMRRVDHELLLTARSLGASPLEVAFGAYWPQIRKCVSNALLLVFSLTTGLFLIPALLGGPDDTVLGKVMLGDLVYDFQNGAGMAATAGVVMTLTVLVATLVCLALGGRPFHRRSRTQ